MDELLAVCTSWQFLWAALIVFMVFALFDRILGPLLWQYRRLRRVLKILEAIKLIWPPILGFGLGWIPSVPRPEQLVNEERLTLASIYALAGLASQWLVKGVRKALESRGIDTELDIGPREQKRRRLL